MSEVDAAAIAASSDPAVNPAAPTFFDKLVAKEIPASILYEDDQCMAFSDINPQGPVHFIVIPKNKDGLNRLSNAREDQKGLLVRTLHYIYLQVLMQFY
jgi:histidine triad (HIT) family protein